MKNRYGERNLWYYKFITKEKNGTADNFNENHLLGINVVRFLNLMG